MSALYLETSAVLAWLLGEPRAGEVREAVEAAGAVVTSSLTFAEAGRALVRAGKQSFLREADVQSLRGVLERAKGGWMAMVVSETVLARAGMPFPVEPVRALDAIHLATALEFRRAFADLRILTHDARLRANAVALGVS